MSAPAAGRARTEILDAAAVLLGRDGYQAATVRAFAARVGIKAASIYHHFPSKDAIVQAVLDRGVVVVHEAVEHGALGIAVFAADFFARVDRFCMPACVAVHEPHRDERLRDHEHTGQGRQHGDRDKDRFTGEAQHVPSAG